MKWAHLQKYSFLSLQFYLALHKLHKYIDWIRVVLLILKLGEEERKKICELSVEFQFCVKGFTKYCICYHLFIYDKGPLNNGLSLAYRLDTRSVQENRYLTPSPPNSKASAHQHHTLLPPWSSPQLSRPGLPDPKVQLRVTISMTHSLINSLWIQFPNLTQFQSTASLWTEVFWSLQTVKMCVFPQEKASGQVFLVLSGYPMPMDSGPHTFFSVLWI